MAFPPFFVSMIHYNAKKRAQQGRMRIGKNKKQDGQTGCPASIIEKTPQLDDKEKLPWQN